MLLVLLIRTPQLKPWVSHLVSEMKTTAFRPKRIMFGWNCNKNDVGGRPFTFGSFLSFL